jgi:formaldehyde-activating enzyme involved in methanogenesis
MRGSIGRREFVHGVGLVVGAALAATAGDAPALAQLTTNIGPKPMTYEIKALTGTAARHLERPYAGILNR